jgi:hypothetical protein
MGGHLEACHNRQKERRSGNEQEGRCKWACCSRECDSSPKDCPAPTTAAQDHQPVKEDIEDIAIPGYVYSLASQEREGEEDYYRKDGSVV